MNKNILVKLASIAAAASLLVGGAYAAFTSNSVTITGVVLSSATPALQVYNGTTYADTADLGISESGMYPGWEGSADHTFWLKNTSTDAPLGQILATLPSATTPADWVALKDVVRMQFVEVGQGVSSPPYTLSEWNAGPSNIMGPSSTIPIGTEKQFAVHFSMDSGATENAKGKSLNMILSFVGLTP